jgi:DNA-binding NtrC family response regulator
MRIEDLEAKELFEFDTAGGLIRFAGRRALAIDATAMGSLRKELVTQFGLTAARAVLTRFGFVHGWRLAEAMETQFNWESPEDWGLAGSFLPMLEGMYRLEPGTPGPLSKDGFTILGSFEAEQHTAHLGRSDSAVCWTLCGLASGYLSRAMGKDIFVLEDHCVGKGDANCRLLGRTREEWGDSRARELRFFHSDNLGEWLDADLHQVTEELRQAEDKLRDRKRALALGAPAADDLLGMVARSAPMRKLLNLARRIAKVDSTLLITGESGTGKERVARLVHEASARADGPFIAVNCGAITETLLESELFGHVRGAFTGAVTERAGLFEAANGGTLLLDEVGEVSPAMQVKLLRVLQEREIRRVGDSLNRPIDVRVIAATNRELTQEMADGRFRKDLYYRLNVVELHVPSLRERREDILPLARALLTEAATRLNRPITGLSPRAADQLLRYHWPGNVRELENAMERAVALAQVNHTEVEDLPEEVRQAVPIPALATPVKPLEAIERDYILAVLELNGGNQTRTAEQLGIGSATLYRKLKTYGVAKERHPPELARQLL